MPKGRRHRSKAMLLDQESWIMWYELGNLEGLADSWCCRIIKEGDFEEEMQSKLYELFGERITPLRVNFCMHCGKPLEYNSESLIHYEDCCCNFSALIGFIEIFDPRAGIIHRLRGNFCFNCGKRINRISHN